MKKKLVIILCVLTLLISSVGCKQETRGFFSLKGFSVAPYEITGKEQMLLKSYGVESGCLIEYYAPKEVKSIEISTYALIDNKWDKNNSARLNLYQNTSKDDGFRGLISCQTNGSKDEFIIDVKITTSAEESVTISSPRLEKQINALAFSPQYLENERNIEHGKEIPIVIYQYSAKDISSAPIESFINPKDYYKDVELVQAVTIKFIYA